MTTSGSSDFNLTARQLITFAHKKLNITARTAQPSAEDMRDGIELLNLMLKGLEAKAPSLWRQTFGSVALVANTASYTLDPQPYRLVEARYRDANWRDLPMNQLTRQEYVDLPLKASTGIPTNYYIDYQRSAATLYVWPVPAAVTTETIAYTYQRRFEDIDAAANDIDIMPEYLETLGYNLADRIAENHNKRVKRPDITTRAKELMEDLLAADREDEIRFVPERRR